MATVVLNTNTALDLRLITALARELKIGMFSINKEEQEDLEDVKLLSFMKQAYKEGLADKNEVLSKLGLH
ncbi:MAG: hypothetical protein LBM68_00980 [Bacteroidales bacterium]|jgi:hypothetical protein|nr:hypothetical protein [Bacteroidales bacterium]